MNSNNSTPPKSTLLIWLLLPLILVWFAVSYLTGVARQPVWQDRDTQPKGQVLATQDVLTPLISPPASDDFIWADTGLVTFWFDDGWLTQYTVGVPILEKYGYKAAIAITTDYIGYEAYMTWGQVKRLHHFYQWDISAHSRTHNCDAATFTPASIQTEVVGAYQDLLSQGIDVDTYVLPCSVKTPELIQAIKNTYSAMRDSGSEPNPLPVADPYAIHAITIHDQISLERIQAWVNQAKTEKSWLILMFHQLDRSQTEYSLRPETFDQIVALVQQSGLPVVDPQTVLNITPPSPL